MKEKRSFLGPLLRRKVREQERILVKLSARTKKEIKHPQDLRVGASMTESKPSQVRPDASCDRSPVKAEETLSSVGLKEMVVELEMADLNFLVPDADRDTSALGSSAVQPAIDDERDGALPARAPRLPLLGISPDTLPYHLPNTCILVLVFCEIKIRQIRSCCCVFCLFCLSCQSTSIDCQSLQKQLSRSWYLSSGLVHNAMRCAKQINK